MQRLDGDEQLFVDMAGLFLKFQAELLSAVAQAIENADASELRRSAHGLKGALSDFTSSAPFQTARALEEIAANGRLSQAGTVAATLNSQVQELCDELKRYLASDPYGQETTVAEPGV